VDAVDVSDGVTVGVEEIVEDVETVGVSVNVIVGEDEGDSD
jgi:hypothetical protein